MIKVIHVITDLSVGGAEMMLYKILNTFDSNKFYSTVLTLMPGGPLVQKIEDLGIKVETLGISRGKLSLAPLGELINVVRKYRPDIIQGWMYHSNIVAWLACLFAKDSPRLYWNIRHSLYDLRYEKKLTQHIIRANKILSARADALLYNSNIAKKQHEEFGFCSKKSHVIYNGFELEKYRFSQTSRKTVRKSLSVSSGTKIIGHVARYHPMKDHKTFIAAAVLVAERHENTHFVLVGRNVIPSNPELVVQIPVRLRSRFHFLGEQEDICALMCAMDILVSSSYSEGFANVLGEAMAIGLPCVATDVGESAMILGDLGVIVPPKDEVELAKGIVKYLALDTKALSRIRKQMKDRAEKYFSIDAVSGELADLYTEITMKNQRRML